MHIGAVMFFICSYLGIGLCVSVLHGTDGRVCLLIALQGARDVANHPSSKLC